MLYNIIGLPGSGKSTLCKKLQEKFPNEMIYDEDVLYCKVIKSILDHKKKYKNLLSPKYNDAIIVLINRKFENKLLEMLANNKDKKVIIFSPQAILTNPENNEIYGKVVEIAIDIDIDTLYYQKNSRVTKEQIKYQKELLEMYKTEKNETILMLRKALMGMHPITYYYRASIEELIFQFKEMVVKYKIPLMTMQEIYNLLSEAPGFLRNPPLKPVPLH